METSKRISSIVGGAPNVAVGESHVSLEAVQQYLQQFGYLSKTKRFNVGTLDGPTMSALRKFQRQFKVSSTGLLDPLSRALMSQARCGMTDLRHSLAARARLSGWDKKEILFAFGQSPPPIDLNKSTAAVKRAFNTWEAAGVGLTFIEVSDTESPDILIDWRDENDPDFSMVGDVIAHADYPPPNSQLASSPPLPLHFDTSEYGWVDGAYPSCYDLETVALHEIGHCLGLEHSTVAGSVMWPIIPPNFTLTQLQQDDVNQVQLLYSLA